ncbi:MAG: sulfatase-like hydrolase/transferase, partial [Planctomycetaceae bacterium]|nr:sulfatase-like hydrolase/transferase [Planctomycetaceae bacterium]
RKVAAYRGDEWKYLKENHRWREAVQAYLASISFADALVGELLKALENSPHAENTIIVLWSDHGWHLGEKQHWHKFTLWEEATRVPLIIAGPNIAKPGTRTSQPVGLIDLYPTLCELCGIPIPEQLDGTSLCPLVRDPTVERKQPALTTHGPGNHSLRTERYRYIRYADGSEEFYDHQTDPQEWHNLAGESRVARLKQRLQVWFPKSEAKPAPSKQAYDFDPVRYRWKPKK